LLLQVGGSLPGGIILRGLSGGERKRLSIAQGNCTAQHQLYYNASLMLVLLECAQDGGILVHFCAVVEQVQWLSRAVTSHTPVSNFPVSFHTDLNPSALLLLLQASCPRPALSSLMSPPVAWTALQHST
jgi:hypothetical protein